MSLIQKIFEFILPERCFEKIKEESSKWFFVCDDCGYEKSVWDGGGLRFFACQNRPRYGKCPKCKKFKILYLRKKV